MGFVYSHKHEYLDLLTQKVTQLLGKSNIDKFKWSNVNNLSKVSTVKELFGIVLTLTRERKIKILCIGGNKSDFCKKEYSCTKD